MQCLVQLRHIFLGVVLVCIGFGFGCRTDDSKDPQSDLKISLDAPFVLTPRSLGRLDLPYQEINQICRLSHPLENGMTASLMLHVLHAHGLEARFDNPRLPAGEGILKLFTDDQAARSYLGEPAVTVTRHGVRCAINPQNTRVKELHRDQALAVFSELGLPLSTPLSVSGATYQLQDMLTDSIANYSFRQSEIDWTAFAYSLYLPPRTSWKNKFGEEFTFDDLAETVMRRRLDSSSCAGSHLVWAMIALVRVDKEKSAILSTPVREKLWKRLGKIVQAAVEQQAPDGSWGTDWNAALLPKEPKGRLLDHRSLAHKLLATSHIPEWMMYLPQELQVPDEVIQQAGRWLFRQWSAIDDKTFVAENFCPCSHAAVVLGMLCKKEHGNVEPPLIP